LIEREVDVVGVGGGRGEDGGVGFPYSLHTVLTFGRRGEKGLKKSKTGGIKLPMPLLFKFGGKL